MQQLLGVRPRLSLLWDSCELLPASEARSSALSPARAKEEKALRVFQLCFSATTGQLGVWLLPVEKRARDSLVRVLSWGDLFSDGQVVFATFAQQCWAEPPPRWQRGRCCPLIWPLPTAQLASSWPPHLCSHDLSLAALPMDPLSPAPSTVLLGL